MGLGRMPWYKQLWAIKLSFVLVLTPIVFIPIPIIFPSPAGRCAYAILIMAFYWMTEVIPMAVTALLPVVIMPWLGIMSTKDISQNYLKDANMLFLGGLVVAVAVEKWNLHKRIALRVLMLVGSKPRWLMFGFMATTAFLSMWISNTATTAMMVPISHAVLTELGNHRRKTKAAAKQLKNGYENRACSEAINMDDSVGDKNDSNYVQPQSLTTYFTGDEVKTTADYENLEDSVATPHQPPQHHQNAHDSSPDSHNHQAKPTENNIVAKKVAEVADEEMDDDDRWFDNVGKGMRLSIAYAANIGGTATLTGTGPNLVLKGQVDLIYGPDTGINFSSWFVFAFPNMLISLLLAWFWLMLVYLGPKEIYNFCRRRKKGEQEEDSATEVINREYQKLGKMSFAEAAVLTHFIVLALLWLTRDPEIVPGWGTFLTPRNYVTDACVAITISVLLFMCPSKWPNYLCFRRKSEDDETSPPGPAPPILDWPTIHKQIPWNVMLLLGGGFALADACKVSGLSAIIGELFISFKAFPKWILVLILSTLTATFTEVTSNVATATIFLPILAELAKSLQINPLYLMLPVTISASFAFMLPVATPPNAIVFAYGNMRILDMMKAGIVMNTLCLLVLQLAINTWGYSYFNLHEFPAWAGNLTLGALANASSIDM